jgi:phosphatidate cytidylyltransferase
MYSELKKRISTGLVLFLVLFYCLYYSGLYFVIFLSLVYCLSFFEIIKNTRNLLFIIISNIVLIFALFSFYYLRGQSDYSLTVIYWILMTTFLSDIGGYTFGKIFKGKKLTKISPNKTYSGSIGSIIFCVISLPSLNLFQFFFLNENLINFYQIKYIVLSIVISIICQSGDLYISYWKRKLKVKDTSNILPGHGGVLDRIDGLIFVLIFSFLINKVGLI